MRCVRQSLMQDTTSFMNQRCRNAQRKAVRSHEAVKSKVRGSDPLAEPCPPAATH